MAAVHMHADEHPSARVVRRVGPAHKRMHAVSGPNFQSNLLCSDTETLFTARRHQRDAIDERCIRYTAAMTCPSKLTDKDAHCVGRRTAQRQYCHYGRTRAPDKRCMFVQVDDAAVVAPHSETQTCSRLDSQTINLSLSSVACRDEQKPKRAAAATTATTKVRFDKPAVPVYSVMLIFYFYAFLV